MKMLLGALGYDAAIEGYVGTNWSIAVAKRALNIGLDSGLVGDFAGAKALTREEACLYAFNAMKADMVEYDQKSTISVGDLTITQNSECSVITDDKNDMLVWDETALVPPQTATLQFAEKYFSDLSVTPDTDAFMRPATSWSYDGDPIGTYADAADFVYVNSFDKAAKKALEKAKYDLTSEAVVYYNGAAAGADMDTIAELVVNDKAVTGWTIEMFVDKDKDVNEVIIIEEFFAQVGKFTAANEKKGTDAKVVIDVVEASAGTKTVTVVDDPDSDTDMYDAIAAYEKDDYIAVTMKSAWDTTANLAKGAEYVLAVSDVEAVEGKVQKVTDNGYVFESTIKMDGTTYKLNNECVGVVNCGTPVVATDEGTLYLDAQGCVIGWVAKTDAISDKAIAVTDCFQTIEDGKLVTKVEGVLSNGETTTLKVAAGSSVAEYQVYTYSDVEEDGIYELDSTPTGSISDGDGATVDTTRAFTTTEKALSGAYYASDVKFIFVDDANDELTIKEGLQKVASGSQKYLTIDVVDGVKYITAVFVEAAPVGGTATADALIYVAKATGTISIEIDEEDEEFYTYEAYVNGELVENFYSDDSVTVGKFYKNEIDNDTGAYVLSGKEYTFTSADDIGVAYIATVTSYTAKVIDATYGAGAAEIVDLSTNFDGIEAGCKAAVMYDIDTMEAMFVYVMNA
jgi:hypothetical protein